MKKLIVLLVCCPVILIVLSSYSYCADPNIIGVIPAGNSLNVSPESTITVRLAVTPNQIPNEHKKCVMIHGSMTGCVDFTYFLDHKGNKVIFVPAEPFHPGEIVTVTLTEFFGAFFGSKTVPMSWRFTVRASQTEGTFVQFSSVVFGGELTECLKPGDIDNDGDIDLVAFVLSHPRIAVLRNDGTGNFLCEFYEMIFPKTGDDCQLVLSDVNSDGYLDAVFTSLTDENYTLGIMQNDRSGRFSIKNVLYEGAGTGMSFSDYDCDGDIDLIGGAPNLYAGAGRNIACENMGYGEFRIRDLFWTYCGCLANPHYYAGLLTGDFNNDGFPDITVMGRTFEHAIGTYCNYLLIYSRDQEGYFSARSLPFAEFNTITDVNDIDGNGIPDFTVHPNWIYSVGIENSTFTSFPGTGGAYASGDIDGDGDIDIIESNPGSRKLRVIENDGQGSLAVTSQITARITGKALALADFDNDGDLDIASKGERNGSVTVFKNQNSGSVSDNESGEQSGISISSFRIHPNPFNPMTKIRFETDRHVFAELTVYDNSGRTVRTLIESTIGKGLHEVEFDGRGLASGVYFCKLEINGNPTAFVRRMMLVK